MYKETGIGKGNKDCVRPQHAGTVIDHYGCQHTENADRCHRHYVVEHSSHHLVETEHQLTSRLTLFFHMHYGDAKQDGGDNNLYHGHCA